MENHNQIDCIQKKIKGNWLTGGHLYTCILKLTEPDSNKHKYDDSRPENIAITTKLLKPLEGSEESLLEQESSNEPSLVLAPELSFGTPDFASLDTLIKDYKQSLIFICGFGFSTGKNINNLISCENVEGIWNRHPNNDKIYNGGWVWVKNKKCTQCYIFLKNFFEQNREITIPNLTAGKNILRLEGEDIVVFPMICADLISIEENSPSKRIMGSLSKNSSSNKKILVTVSSLDKNSASGYWKAAIGDLLASSNASNMRLILSNCVTRPPKQDENEDKWRCLSGVYQHREKCKPPCQPLPNIRYVDDTKFSGFVLRNPNTGASFGKLQWTNSLSEGRHAFSSCSQYIWHEEKLCLCDGNCVADELYRFILRNKGCFLDKKISLSSISKELSLQELNSLLGELSPTSSSPLRDVAGDLLQKCIKGVNQESVCPDQLHEKPDSLDCAITTLRIVQHAIKAKLMPSMPKNQELEYGQLLSEDKEHELLIWDSDEYPAVQLYNMVKDNIVKDGGSKRPLTVICRGNGGGTLPDDGRILSDRYSDMSNSSPTHLDSTTCEEDIREPKDRVAIWKNQGSVDNILHLTDSKKDLIKDLQEEICLSTHDRD